MLQRFPVGKYLGINIFMWGFFLMLQAAATVIYVDRKLFGHGANMNVRTSPPSPPFEHFPGQQKLLVILVSC